MTLRRLRVGLLGVSAAALVGACGGTPATYTNGGRHVPAQRGHVYRWTFDSPGGLPSDFIRVLGQWGASIDGSAPSAPAVLRQTGSSRRRDFPRVVLRDLDFTDLTVRVRCRADRGVIDRACGLMFRLLDSRNYYVARGNAVENNVGLYRVVDGERRELASADRAITSGRWHLLEASARGSALSVRWDGALVISLNDATFTTGRIGLWTKADSVTSFDDLEAVAE